MITLSGVARLAGELSVPPDRGLPRRDEYKPGPPVAVVAFVVAVFVLPESGEAEPREPGMVVVLEAGVWVRLDDVSLNNVTRLEVNP